MGTKNYFQYFYGILQEQGLTSILTIVLYEKFNTSFVLNTSYDCQPSIYDKFYQLYLVNWSLSVLLSPGGKVHGCRPYCSMNLFIFLWCVVQMWRSKTVPGYFNKTLRTNLRDGLVEKFSSDMGGGLSGRV